MVVPGNTLALSLSLGLGLSTLFAINVVVGPSVYGEPSAADEAPLRLALATPGSSVRADPKPSARRVVLLDAPETNQPRTDAPSAAPTAEALAIGSEPGTADALLAANDVAEGETDGFEGDRFEGDEIGAEAEIDQTETDDIQTDLAADDVVDELDELVELDGPDEEPAPLPGQVEVYFARERATLGPRSRRRLDRVAARLLGDADLALEVRGHTDGRGDSGYNYRLSERRARRVAGYLRDRGVDGDRLEVVSLGATDPAVPGNTESAWRKNRRVELVWRSQ